MALLKLVFCFFLLNWAYGNIQVRDDSGTIITLAQPAKRIISLAPHLTELLFAAGAGSHIVGVSAYSDYPRAAKKITLVGDSRRLDIEKIAALHPDLIIAWHAGNHAGDLHLLTSLHVPIYRQNTGHLLAIATTLQNLGKLAGTNKIADDAALQFNKTYQQLEKRYHRHKPIPVFFQLWPQPLMTIGQPHFINDVFALCGAENIFSSYERESFTVDVEAVIARAPYALIGDDTDPHWYRQWLIWTTLPAVKQQRFITLHADEITRYGPRILLAAAQLCVALART